MQPSYEQGIVPAMPLFASYKDFVRLEARAVSSQRLLLEILEKVRLMPTAADITAKIAALTAEVAKETDAITAIKTYVDGLKTQLTDVQTQLTAAVAANDPTALQGASDALDALAKSVDANAAAEAAIVNTPAAPQP